MINFTITLSYGLRFLLNLALHDNSPKQLRRIAHEENIPLPYLRKLVPLLERAGLIKSIKGPGGGFSLNRRPSEIYLSEVTNTLSRDKLQGCLTDPSNCRQYGGCAIKDLLVDVYGKVREVLDNKTLETLVKEKVKNG